MLRNIPAYYEIQRSLARCCGVICKKNIETRRNENDIIENWLLDPILVRGQDYIEKEKVYCS